MKYLGWALAAAWAASGTNLAFADPPSAILQAVELETSSGPLRGFAVYSSEDMVKANREKLRALGLPFEEEDKAIAKGALTRPLSEDDIEQLLLGKDEIFVYPKAYLANYPQKMLLITEPGKKIHQSDISVLELSTSTLNGFAWYGRPNQVDERGAQDLQTKPLYSCTWDPNNCCEIDYWLSYNPAVGATQLDPFCKGPPSDSEGSKAYFEKIKNLNYPDVYRLVQDTD